jgi:hypothetical protein
LSKTYLLYSTDWHAGHAGGVLAPGTKIKYNTGEKPETVELTPTDQQQAIWDMTANVLAAVEKRTAGAPIIMVQGGDIINGNRFVESMVNGGGRIANQVAIAGQFFAEIRKRLPNIAEFYTVYGTGVHALDEGSAEEIITDKIGDLYGIASHSADHILLDVDGCQIDIAHHGPGAGRAWTQDNPARLYLLRTMMDDMDILNTRPAAVYLRGHVHQYSEAHARIERAGRIWKSQLFVMPAMCLMNGHARKVSRSQSYSRHGWLLLEITDGRLSGSWPMIKAFSSRTVYRAVNMAYNKGNFSQGDGQMG